MSQPPPFRSPQNKPGGSLRGWILLGLLLLALPGLFGSQDPGAAAFAGGAMMIAVVCGVVGLGARALRNLFGPRR